MATTASTAKSQRALLNLRSMEGGLGGSLAASMPLDRRESFRALNGLGGPATPRGSADPPSLLGSVLGGEDGGGAGSARGPLPLHPHARRCALKLGAGRCGGRAASQPVMRSVCLFISMFCVWLRWCTVGLHTSLRCAWTIFRCTSLCVSLHLCMFACLHCMSLLHSD